MASKFNRASFLNRLGVSAGVGALAIITGACGEGAGTDADTVPANNGASETAAENPAASTDGEASTDMAAPSSESEGEASTDAEETDENS